MVMIELSNQNKTMIIYHIKSHKYEFRSISNKYNQAKNRDMLPVKETL